MLHPVFQGISQEEVWLLLEELGAYSREYEKGEYLLLQGDRLAALGLLLSGRAFVEKEDVFGKNFLHLELRLDSPWGVSFLYPAPKGSDVSCRAARYTRLLFIPWERLLLPVPSCEKARQKLIENFWAAAVLKNRIVMEKLNILSRKSLRERIWLYLRGLMKTPEDIKLLSPLNRTELSRFLGVNRSALCRELSRMEGEGLLQIEKNTYTVLHLEKTALLRSPPLFSEAMRFE